MPIPPSMTIKKIIPGGEGRLVNGASGCKKGKEGKTDLIC